MSLQTRIGALITAIGADIKSLNDNKVTINVGNAGTATTLATPRNIDGQSFNGSSAITVIAPGTHAATDKPTPVDTDEMPVVDSAASNGLKKVTWANIKATLKTYFDTLYVAKTSAKSLVTRPAIANTETVVISYTCAANELAVGTTFRFKAFVSRSGTQSASPVIRVRVGTTTLTGNIAATLTPPVDALAVGSEIEGLVTVITSGSGGTIRGSLVRRVHLAAVTITDAIASTAAVAVNTTTANMLVELTFISGHAANTYTFENVILEKVVA